jgi:diadenosine tetraphosphate (Ap4A) HIT family hydrolase
MAGLPGPETCPFCSKLAGEASWPDEDVVWQFQHSVAVLGPWQFYQGYCLLIARTHAAELNHLEPAIRRAFFEEMCLLAQAIEHGCRPRKLNYELLGNQVPHLHWHLFPRYDADPDHLQPVWVKLAQAEQDENLRARMAGTPEGRSDIASRLRTQLEILTAP